MPEEDFHTAVDLGDTYPPTVFVDMLRDASEYIPFELEANQWPCCGSRLAAAARRPCSSILSCSRLVAPPPRCARMLATQHNAALLCPLSCRDDGQDCRERGGAALRQCLGGPHSGKRSGLHGCWQCLVSAAACGTLHSICSARTPVRLPDRQPSGFGSGGQQTFLELAQCRALCRPPEAGRAAVLLLHTQSFTPSGVKTVHLPAASAAYLARWTPAPCRPPFSPTAPKPLLPSCPSAWWPACARSACWTHRAM